MRKKVVKSILDQRNGVNSHANTPALHHSIYIWSNHKTKIRIYYFTIINRGQKHKNTFKSCQEFFKVYQKPQVFMIRVRSGGSICRIESSSFSFSRRIFLPYGTWILILGLVLSSPLHLSDRVHSCQLDIYFLNFFNHCMHSGQDSCNVKNWVPIAWQKGN